MDSTCEYSIIGFWIDHLQAVHGSAPGGHAAVYRRPAATLMASKIVRGGARRLSEPPEACGKLPRAHSPAGRPSWGALACGPPRV